MEVAARRANICGGDCALGSIRSSLHGSFDVVLPATLRTGCTVFSTLQISELRPTEVVYLIPQLVCGIQNTQFDLKAPWGPAKQRQKEMRPRWRDGHGPSPEVKKKTREQNGVLGESEAGDDQKAQAARAGLASALGFWGPRRGWMRASSPWLWRGLHAPETLGVSWRGRLRPDWECSVDLTPAPRAHKQEGNMIRFVF